MLRKVPCLRVEDKVLAEATSAVAEEVVVSLTVNGRNLMTALAGPDALEEFVIGFLFTEQIIRSLEEIESIRQEKNSFSVLTTQPFRVLGQKKILLSGCGGSSSFLDARRLPKITSTLVVTPENLRSALQQITKTGPAPRAGGIHQAGLIAPEGTLYQAEDIGRHNALDKAIGIGLKHHLPMTECYAVCSGILSSEMVRKCLVAGIPLIASPAGSTTLAIEVSDKTGLCVVGFTGSAALNIYTHPEHIQGGLRFRD
jgi:FdhD protein